MTERLPLRDAANYLSIQPVSFFKDAFLRDDSGNSFYTRIFLGIIGWFFVLELVLSIQTGAGSTYNLVSYFFVHHPMIAWPVAPLLHKGISHFAANILMIYLAVPVENQLSKLEFSGVILFAGYFPIYLEGWKLSVLGETPHIAAYGASGFAFGLFGYGLIIQLRRDMSLTPRWWLIIGAGFSGVLLVLMDLISGIGNPISINLGHLGGLFTGMTLATMNRISQP